MPTVGHGSLSEPLVMTELRALPDPVFYDLDCIHLSHRLTRHVLVSNRLEPIGTGSLSLHL